MEAGAARVLAPDAAVAAAAAVFTDIEKIMEKSGD